MCKLSFNQIQCVFIRTVIVLCYAICYLFIIKACGWQIDPNLYSLSRVIIWVNCSLVATIIILYQYFFIIYKTKIGEDISNLAELDWVTSSFRWKGTCWGKKSEILEFLSNLSVYQLVHVNHIQTDQSILTCCASYDKRIQFLKVYSVFMD